MAPARAAGSSRKSPLRALTYVGLTLIFLAVLYIGWARTFGPAASETAAPGQQTATFAVDTPNDLYTEPTTDGIVEMPGQPALGEILFGTSFDPGTMVVSGPTTKVAMGASVAVVAHFSQTTSGSIWFNVDSGKTTVQHVSTPLKGDTDFWGLIEQAAILSVYTPGTYQVVITDIGGNQLASGTLTVTP